jgi:hypothetical protein
MTEETAEVFPKNQTTMWNGVGGRILEDFAEFGNG